MPPSAMTGTSCGAAARAHSAIAVIIGTPMPATTRVVQIEPAPMPTLTASTPSSISASVASAVATLPATRSTFGNCAADAARPCRARPASGRARCRRRARRRSRRPAPRRARSCRLRDADRRAARAAGRASPCRRSGYLTAFWMSLTVISPFSRKSWSTTSSFSTLCWCRISRACVERRADRHGEQRLARHDVGDRPVRRWSRTAGRGW